jgi:hypothetical protein
MKINLLTASTLFLLAIPLQGADQAALNENLKPLARLVGRWDVQFTENGEPQNGQFTAKVEEGGAILSGKFQLGTNNTPIFSFAVTYYWQAETKSIAQVYFDSLGAHSTSVMTKQGDHEVWQAAGYTQDGKYVSSVGHSEWKDNDTFVYQSTCVCVGGEAMPDGPKITLKRIKG